MRTDNVKMNRQTTDDARGQRFSLLFLLCFCMMLLLSGCGSEPSYELNETALAVTEGYTYDQATGTFVTVPGVITVPAATFVRDTATGAWTVTPGVTRLTVTGTL